MAFSLKDYARPVPLGQGGLSQVFRARQLSLERTVVLKRMRSQKSGLLLHEARLSAKLRHPNIIAVHDYGSDAGDFYMVMEYVDGVSLEEALRQELPTELALFSLLDICDALEYAHGQGIIHCDLKPSNVLLDSQGKAKLTDFGLAQQGEMQQDEKTLAGTIQYLAPELLKGGGKNSIASDVYALGVILYRIVAGHFPFRGENFGEYATQTLSLEPIGLPRNHFADKLGVLIREAMHKNPEHRPQKASEIKQAIWQCVNEPDGKHQLSNWVTKHRPQQRNEDLDSLIEDLLRAGKKQEAYFLAKKTLNEDPGNLRALHWVQTIQTGGPQQLPRMAWLAISLGVILVSAIVFIIFQTKGDDSSMEQLQSIGRELQLADPQQTWNQSSTTEKDQTEETISTNKLEISDSISSPAQE